MMLQLLLAMAITDVVFSLLGLAMLVAFVRLVRGPSLPDRVVALDLIGTVAVGMIAVHAIATDAAIFLSVAIVLALITFLATVAFANYLEKGGSE